jgi:hypothetical protein
LTVSTCGSFYDTKLAVYEGCGCADHTPSLACNDDFCGLQAEVTVPVTAGEFYNIRVGGYREERGIGFLSVGCEGEPAGACCEAAGCTTRTVDHCAAVGGTFVGPGSVCAPDSDGDGIADPCDGCPSDTLKDSPGLCGCGVIDYDTDADGIPDCFDDDKDGDGVPDAADVSPMDPLACGDIEGDGCDDCSAGRGRDITNDGEDPDDDLFCNVTDCDPEDPNTFPGAREVNDGADNQCSGDPGHGLVDEISGLAGLYDFLNDDRFSWAEQPGATIYVVAVSPHRDFSADCQTFETGNPHWDITGDPPQGAVDHILVRTQAPNIGSWGASSMGERTRVCP